MPEGPEIRRAADQVDAALAGRTVERAYFAFDDLKPYEAALEGAGVIGVTSRGKAMLTRFDNGLTLYSHNQLYGRWYVVSAGKLPKTNRSLRVGIHNDTKSALLYSASDVDVLDDEGLADHPFLARLGPDLLDEELDASGVRLRLADDRFRGRSLGALYLDQGFLAGSGNYLRSEILHFARVHHADRPADLDRPALQRLARQSLGITRRSYRTKGVTNPESRARTLKAEGATYGKYRFAVFGRQGLPCHECGDTIERVDVASRRLYFCPTCQVPARKTSRRR